MHKLLELSGSRRKVKTSGEILNNFIVLYGGETMSSVVIQHTLKYPAWLPASAEQAKAGLISSTAKHYAIQECKIMVVLRPLDDQEIDQVFLSTKYSEERLGLVGMREANDEASLRVLREAFGTKVPSHLIRQIEPTAASAAA